MDQIGEIAVLIFGILSFSAFFHDDFDRAPLVFVQHVVDPANRGGSDIEAAASLACLAEGDDQEDDGDEPDCSTHWTTSGDLGD